MSQQEETTRLMAEVAMLKQENTQLKLEREISALEEEINHTQAAFSTSTPKADIKSRVGFGVPKGRAESISRHETGTLMKT